MVLPRRASQTGSVYSNVNGVNDGDRGRGGSTFRIPLALQTVFLMGNRGAEVNTPPPDATAMKSFRPSRWRLPKRSKSNDSQLTATTVNSIDVTEVPKEVTRSKKSKNKSAPTPTLSPQEYLEGMVFSRGYSNVHYSSLSTAYYNKPTPFQLASFGVYTIKLVQSNDSEGLRELLELGLSPNACNAHGESIVHTICHRSDTRMLDVLLQNGCVLQVADSAGRTPLHEACWAPEPNFSLIERLIEHDRNLLFISDNRGLLPLSGTRKEHWSEWLQFLQSKKDVYWPKVITRDVPELALAEPNSRPIRDPDTLLPLERAQMVAGGKLKPEEARLLNNLSNGIGLEDEDDDDDDDDDDSSGSYLETDDDDSSISSSDSSLASEMNVVKDELDSSWNFDEMDQILNSLSKPNRTPLAW